MLQPLCRFLTFCPESCALGAPDLIHRQIQMAGDMKTIQHVQSLTRLGRDDLQVGFPHVTAHKPQSFYYLRPQCMQAPPERGLRAPASHPEQSPAVRVDLVDDGQKVVRAQTASPMNLVHADGFDLAQFPVRQAPLDKPFHRPIYRFPTGLKCARRFPPTQSSRPAR